MNKSIKLENVSFAYKKENILENINLDLSGDHLVCMIGKNGIGKTTLLKLIAGDYTPNQGKVLIGGENPTNNIEIKREIILSHADIKFLRNCKLDEILKYYKEAYENFDEEFARKLFEIFNLDSKKAFKEHSLGYKSIIKFIFAMASRAPITLLDEPVIGMDMVTRKKVYEIILREYIEHPRLIIISSHMLNEMEDIVDYMIVLEEKQIRNACDTEKLTNLMFRIDGSREQLQEIAVGKKIIRSTYSNIVNFIIVETEDEAFFRQVEEAGLQICRLSLSDICMYQLNDYEQGGMDALWEA